MEIKRFFADKADHSDGHITVYGDEFVHLTKVLRHKVGYKVIVDIDDDNDYIGHITEIGKDYARVEVDEIVPNDCRTRAEVTLFQALPKGDKLDFIIQKCVELGAANITPFLSRFTNEDKINSKRLERIALEACKQCGRSLRPEIGGLLEFDEMVEKLKKYDTVILPYEHATVGSMADVKGLEAGKKIALVIGSEGGFAPEEVEEIVKVGGQVLSLGKRILRCETAAVIGVGLVMYELGELKADK